MLYNVTGYLDKEKKCGLHTNTRNITIVFVEPIFFQ